ncbi:MAG: zinc-ribbon domain-containing protein [Bacilli bacterium]
MKFCPNCGAEIKEGADICVKCGHFTNSPKAKEPTNSTVLAGFILACVSLFLNFWGIIGILATVFSGIGLSKVKKTKGQNKNLAVIGLAIGIFSTIYGLVQVLNLILGA